MVVIYPNHLSLPDGMVVETTGQHAKGGPTDLPTCQACERPGRAGGHDDTPALMRRTTWLCLACGEANCGRNTLDFPGWAMSPGHAELHASQKHSLALDITRAAVWCFECDRAVSLRELQTDRRVGSTSLRVCEHGVQIQPSICGA